MVTLFLVSPYKFYEGLREFFKRKKLTDNPHSGISLDIVQDKVQHLLNCISEFECFPFDPAVPTLRTLQSAIPATDKLIAEICPLRMEKQNFLTLRQRINVLPLQIIKKTSAVDKDKVTTGIS